jgi:hypothetical protein
MQLQVDKKINLVNSFFFDVLGDWIASLFDMKNDSKFRRIANPIQYLVFASFIYFFALSEKMNKLKGKI